MTTINENHAVEATTKTCISFVALGPKIVRLMENKAKSLGVSVRVISVDSVPLVPPVPPVLPEFTTVWDAPRHADIIYSARPDFYVLATTCWETTTKSGYGLARFPFEFQFVSYCNWYFIHDGSEYTKREAEIVARALFFPITA